MMENLEKQHVAISKCGNLTDDRFDALVAAKFCFKARGSVNKENKHM